MTSRVRDGGVSRRLGQSPKKAMFSMEALLMEISNSLCLIQALTNLVGGSKELKNGGERAHWQNHREVGDDARLI